MNNQDLINKLTLGKDYTETVNINGDEIELRPLTSGELAKLQSLEKQGFCMLRKMLKIFLFSILKLPFLFTKLKKTDASYLQTT